MASSDKYSDELINIIKNYKDFKDFDDNSDSAEFNKLVLEANAAFVDYIDFFSSVKSYIDSKDSTTDADKVLEDIEKELNDVYNTFQNEMTSKLNDKIEKLSIDYNETHDKFISAPSFSDEETKLYKKINEIKTSKLEVENKLKSITTEITYKLANVNQSALDIVNSKLPSIYAFSYNEMSNECEHIKGYSFDLVDESTIQSLVNSKSISLPQKTLNASKDIAWNTKHVNSQLLQGILQGESINQIAKRLSSVTNMNKNAAIRNARTMVTSAQNKGRLDSYERALDDGVKLNKKWMSARDDRTRESHEQIDGVESSIDLPFILENPDGTICELMYPGDPDGDPCQVYNCRCTIVTSIKGFKPSDEVKKIEEIEELSSKYPEDVKEIMAKYEDMNDLIDNGKDEEYDLVYGYLLDNYKGYNGFESFDKLKYDIEHEGEVHNVAEDWQGHKMSPTYYELKDENPDLGKEFKKALKDSDDTPANTWAAYLAGELSPEKTKQLDDILSQYNHTGSTAKPCKKDKENKEDAEYDAKKEELEKAKSDSLELSDKMHDLESELYTGIWKNADVTVADYEDKKDSIPSKKEFYENQIKILGDKDTLEDWEEVKLSDYGHKLMQLEEFEQKGEEYLALKEQQSDLNFTINSLKHELNGSFDDGAYSQERKDNAVWAKTAKEADDVLRDVTSKVWIGASQGERKAAFEYTVSFHKFNEPLRGIEYGTSIFKGVGNTDLNAGKAKNGKMLNNLTKIIDKCELPQDQWFQRGCRFGGMDKFLQIDMSTLRSKDQETLEKELLGKNITEYGFMSMGSSKGQGFSGDILFNIYAPAGTKAMYVEPFSAYGAGDGKYWDGKSKQYSFGHELETIMQQNTDFNITKVEVSHGQIYIDLEVIAQNDPQVWKK